MLNNPDVIEKGLMVLENKDIFNIDHEKIYTDLMDRDIKNINVMEFRMVKGQHGFYDCISDPYDINLKGSRWYKKIGKDFYGRAHRIDMAGTIFSDEEVSRFTMEYFKNLKETFKMEYWSDWKETYTEGLSFDVGGIYSLLKECTAYEGIENSYGYAGMGNSMAPIHSEDDDLCSCNICLFGIKVWIVTNAENTKKLRRLITKIGKKLNYNCENVYRHKRTIVTPAFLKKNDIDYSIVHQRPGQIFVSNLMTMHQTLCVTKCFGAACNYATRTWVNMDVHDRCTCDKLTSIGYDKKALQKIQKLLDEKKQHEEDARNILERDLILKKNIPFPDIDIFSPIDMLPMPSHITVSEGGESTNFSVSSGPPPMDTEQEISGKKDCIIRHLKRNQCKGRLTWSPSFIHSQGY